MQDPKKSGGIAKYVLTLLVAVIASVQAATFGMADFRVYQDMKSDIAEVGRRMPIQQDSAGVDPGSVHYAGMGRIVIDGEVMQESASNSVQEIAQPVVSQMQIPSASQHPAQIQQPETPEETEDSPSKEAPKQDAPSSTQAVSKPTSPAPSQSGGGSSSGNGNANNFYTYDNASQQQTDANYVLNTSSKKFHAPSCNDVKRIAEKNYLESNESRDSIIANGYSPCGHCNP